MISDTVEFEYIDCACYSADHVIRFSYDKECNDLVLEVHLDEQYGFFKRIWRALQYVCGYRSKYGNWDCFIITKENADKIKKALEKIK